MINLVGFNKLTLLPTPLDILRPFGSNLAHKGIIP